MASLPCEILKKKKKKANFIETKNKMVVARAWGEGELGRCRSKGTNF